MEAAENLPVLIRERDAAQRLGLSVATLQRLRRSGRIGFVQLGFQVRYTEKILAAYIETSSIPPRPGAALPDEAPATKAGISYEAALTALKRSKPGDGRRHSSSGGDTGR